MSLHSRHASGEVLEMLAREPGCGIPIFHWFSGSIRDLDRAVEMGAWFSVGLPMMRAKRASTIIARIPRNRILTETDAPFASTVDGVYPKKALLATIDEIGKHWKCDAHEVRRTLLENLTRLAEEKRMGATLGRSTSARCDAAIIS